MTRADGVALSLLLILAQTSCAQILGDFEVSATDADGGAPAHLDGRTPCTEATQVKDCGPDGACYVSYCVRACAKASQCNGAPWATCGVGYCSVAIGASCVDTQSCGDGSCEDRDAHGYVVPRYCTVSCVSPVDPAKPCPSGYECASDYRCKPS